MGKANFRAASLGVALVLLALIPLGSAQVRKEKPRVPPGVDPGGVAIAIIGAGIDYTRPDISARLARDGEGEIIGWDFVDNDRRPFEACGRPLLIDERCDKTIAATVLRNAPNARLVVLRTTSVVPQSMVDAILLATRGPAQVLLVVPASDLALRLAREAGPRFPKHLIIVGNPELIGDDKLFQDLSELPKDIQTTMPANVVVTGAADRMAGFAASRIAQRPGLSPTELARELIVAATRKEP